MYPDNPDRYWDPTVNYTEPRNVLDTGSVSSESDLETLSIEEEDDGSENDNDILFNPKFIKRCTQPDIVP